MNRCPACGNTAMSLREKFAGKSLSCSYCHTKLRLRFAPTAALGLVIYISIMFAGVHFGVNIGSILLAICCLLAFLLVALFMPLEVIKDDHAS